MAAKNLKLITEVLKTQKFTAIDNVERLMGDYFTENDFEKGDSGDYYIKHAGLLRVLKNIFKIEKYCAEIKQCAEKSNDWNSSVSVTIIISRKDSSPDEFDKFSWTSVADCNKINSCPGFEKFPTAMAETRAALRCLRFLLGIDFCGAEEIDKDTEVVDENEPIKHNQIILLEGKFMGELGVTFEEISKIVGREVNKLSSLTYLEASALIPKLNKRKISSFAKEGQ